MLLSICIPTYNRSKLLDKCLQSIVAQFNKVNLLNEVEIVISNNNSQDNTEEIVNKFKNKYKNIRYFKNRKNIGGDPNIIKCAGYARGNYIWFFPDDDLQYHYSLEKVIEIIKNFKPDTINVNLDLISKDGKHVDDKNLLRLEKDVIIRSKKELFLFLENKFFLTIDWYITCMTSVIVKRTIFNNNIKKVLNNIDLKTSSFPHVGLIYYTSDDLLMYFVKKSLAKYRRDNRSFGPQDKIDFMKLWYPILNAHYNLLSAINNKNISFKFRFLMYVKVAVRNLRLIFIKYLKLDIAAILMRLFYKDSEGKSKKWSISF